jgi:cytochrome c-type biogenesis protein CcmH/NrfG
MTEQPRTGATTRGGRPVWHLPLVTALVIVAAILVLYPSVPPG